MTNRTPQDTDDSAALVVPAQEIRQADEFAGDKYRKYIDASRAKSTMGQYSQDWAHFCRWCALQGEQPLPAKPTTVADYLVALAEGSIPWETGAEYDNKPHVRKISTLNRKKCAISKHHWLACIGLPDDAKPNDPTKHPGVRVIWEGIRRILTVSPIRKHPISADQLVRMMDDLPDGLIGARDGALLLVGFFGAFRRSELVAIDIEHVNLTPYGAGMMVRVPRSKTDPEGRGRDVPVATPKDERISPVVAYKKWMSVSGVSSGPVFRPIFANRTIVPQRLGDRSVALRIKAAAKKLGLEPEDFAGHSLRSGFVTESYVSGATSDSIMEVTGHKTYDMLRRYIREVDIWRDPAGSHIGGSEQVPWKRK